VLPFTTIAGAEAYLADGVTEAITRELGHIKGARVIASNTAFAYRDRNERGAEVGRELGADLILRGSVQRAGERVRISAVLIATVDGSTLWSHHYDRVPAADILAVQDDIAWQVAVKLANAIGAPPPPRPPDAPKTTPEAYDAFLRGLSFSREGPRGFPKAIEAFERAVGLDANFALGRARLATAYTQQFFYNAADPALERQAFVEIEKALALNPDLAEAHLARAQLVWNLRNGFPHERAIADLRRALASNPNLSEAHVELGKLYFHIGLTAKAIAANEEALRLDPRAAGATERRLLAMIDGGLTEQVRSELARNPQWSPRARATALSFLERTEDAIGEILPGGHGAGALKKLDMTESALLAQLLARSGRADDARRTLAVAIPLAANPTGLSDTHHAQFAIGCAHALLGDRERAVEWVTRAANEGYPSFPRFSREPDLASIRDHPGFVALMIRLKSDYDRWRDLP
jgi:adenylate cyclase